MTVAKIEKIFILTVALLFFLAFLIVYIKSRGYTWGALKKIIRERIRIRWWTLAAGAVFTAVFVSLCMENESHSASATITLNYAEASEGENANGTRFNMSEILSDEVITRAIEKGALKNVTSSQLVSSLSVGPTVQGDSSYEEGYHIATEFYLHFQANDKTEHLDAGNVVQLVAEAYKELYIEKYTDSFSALDTLIHEEMDLQNMDYLDIAEHLSNQVDLIKNYMYEYAEKYSSFVGSNGENFFSLASKAENIEEVQIEQNLEAYLLQNGISKNPAEYIGRLSYENRLMDFDNQKVKASYNIRNTAISMYSEEMTRVVLVPTWDTDGEYYMGRTKVGIDELSVEAKSYSEESAEYLKKISTNQSIISSLENSSVSGENENVNRMIGEIWKDTVDLASSAKQLAREYSDEKLNKCISSNIQEASFSKRIAVWVMTPAFFVLALNVLMTVSAIPSRKKKNNQ